VDCVRSGTSKSRPVMELLRHLFFVCAQHNFAISAVHIAGAANTIADALSRFCMQVFRQHAPQARVVADTAILPRWGRIG